MFASPTPLQWPSNFARTTEPIRGRFQMTFPAALKSLHAAMGKRGLARHEYVISSNLPLKNNGDPTPVGNQQGDRGIAVYWREQGKPVRVVACDQFFAAEHNIRAIALAMEHLRDMERWGCSQLVEHIMTGFALPPAGGTAGQRVHEAFLQPPWLAAFGFQTLQGVDFDRIHNLYRKLARIRHPDQGGSAAAMAELNNAYEAAKLHFGAGG